MGNVKTYQVGVYTGTAYTNYYSYSYARYDGYQESQVYGSSSYFQPGTTASSYDINGKLVSVSESFATSKSRSFVTDQAGHILQKTENGKTQNYFYANDKALGSSGALGTADFDYNYTPVSAQYPAATPGSYVVSAGDSLRSIALAVYGDAQLWYLIADANGLKTDADLQVGRNLSISNKVTNLRNAYDTFKPYAPGQIIGDTTPTLPEPPPPPAQSSGDGGCGGLGSIIVMAVAIVATVMTAGAMLPQCFSSLGAMMSAGAAALTTNVGIALVAGAIGSIASQAVGVALGVQESFSWKNVALSAIGAGVTAGLGAGGITGGISDTLGSAVAGAVLKGSLSQGIAVAIGLQEKFDWKGVAASAVGAAMSYGADWGLPRADTGNAWGGLLRSAAVGMAGGAAQQLVYGGKANWGTVAADAFGNALGSSVVGSMSSTTSTQENALRNATQDAYSYNAPYSGDPNSADFVGPPAPAEPRFGKLGSGTYGLGAEPGQGFMLVDPSQPLPSSVRAGDYGGSLERIARAQLGTNASQREISNYVGQLFEANDITNARTIGPNRQILLPDAIAPAATVGLGRYGKDIAIGESRKAAEAATAAAQLATAAYTGGGSGLLVDPATGQPSFAYSSQVSCRQADAAQVAALQANSPSLQSGENFVPIQLEHDRVYVAVRSVANIASSTAGLVTSGGAFAVGAGLALNPTLVTAPVGLGLMVYGGSTFLKNAGDLALNIGNLWKVGSGTGDYYQDSLPEHIVKEYYKGSENEVRLAALGNAVWDATNPGKLVVTTGAKFVPGTAALLQTPLKASVDMQATWRLANTYQVAKTVGDLKYLNRTNQFFDINENLLNPYSRGYLQNTLYMKLY